jgi:hypothetical protein
MNAISLQRGIPAPIARAGATLAVINHPFRDWAQISNIGIQAAVSAYILVGFDRTPSSNSYDASVPPFQVATIPVPDSVRIVTLLWTTDFQASPIVFGAGMTVGIAIDWIDCEFPAGLAPADAFLPLIAPFASGGNRFGTWIDHVQGAWAPGRLTPLLDQALTGIGNPKLRPLVAPSQSVTKTGVLVANTLTALTGVVAVGTGPGQGSPLLRRLIISVSGAGLVVVGGNGLTVGAPGAQEVVRMNAAAAGVLPPVDFGEGLDLCYNGNAGTWSYYAGTAITVDITAILG